MAAALARDLLGEGAQVESAGTEAENGAGATPEAIQVMSERGLNILNHRSRSLQMVNLPDYDLVIALTPAIGQTLLEKGVHATKLHVLNIPDPLGRGLKAYRETAVAIERELKRLFDLRGDAAPPEVP
jgi:protein-tyrosine phosphatase